MYNGAFNIDDSALFDALAQVIKRRIPGFKIKFKTASRWQKFIGFIAFWMDGYMERFTTTTNETVWFPSRDFIESNRVRAFKILAHEYVHLLDIQKKRRLFEIGYASPQLMSVFSILALLSIWFTNWWLVFLVFLVCLAPWPAMVRTELEKRGYAMNIAINIWRYGSIHPDTKEWLKDVFTGWGYYRMSRSREKIDNWIEEMISEVNAVDHLRPDKTILGMSLAFKDVYQLVKGIDFSEAEEM